MNPIKSSGITSKAAFVIVILLLPLQAVAQAALRGELFCTSIMSRYKPTINNMTSKGWEYSNSIVLHGMQQIYEKNGNSAYFDYIKAYIDSYIGSDGTAVISRLGQNLDKIHPGVLCLFLYRKTGEEKYKRASGLIRSHVDTYPRNNSGGFWHKDIYADQMWLDGIYMAQPFLINYGFMMNDEDYCSSEAVLQTMLLYRHAFNSQNKLLYHGWDESRSANWANPQTGVSPEIWSRAVGWYVMALVDILKYLPDTNPGYDSLITVLGNVAQGIKNSQDSSSDLWFQLMDKGGQSGNWVETSGSAMFVYALKTAVDYGWIDTAYLEVVRRGWAALGDKVVPYTDGGPQIREFCAALGIRRLYSEYTASSLRVNCPAPSGTQHPHGYCGILFAASVMEYQISKKVRLQITQPSNGRIVSESYELYQDQGDIVMLSALPDEGYVLSRWTGDLSAEQSPASVTMDKHKSISAEFALKTNVVRSPSATNRRTLLFQKIGLQDGVAVLDIESSGSVSVSVRVSGISGRTVYSGNLLVKAGRNRHVINLKAGRKGMYLVRVAAGDDVYVRKLIAF